MYLKEERDKYGESGWKDHAIVAGQVAAGQVLSFLGGAAGGISTLFVGGGIPGAIAGAVSVSFTYENVDIGGQSLKDHMRDMIVSVINKPYKERKSTETTQINQNKEFSEQKREDILNGVKEVKSKMNENFFVPILSNSDFLSSQKGVDQFNELIIDMSPQAIRRTFNMLDLKYGIVSFTYQPEIHKNLFKTLDNKGIFLDGYTIENLSAGFKYTPKSGETLINIADKYDILVNEITSMIGNEHLAKQGDLLSSDINIPISAYQEDPAQENFKKIQKDVEELNNQKTYDRNEENVIH